MIHYTMMIRYNDNAVFTCPVICCLAYSVESDIFLKILRTGILLGLVLPPISFQIIPIYRT